MTNTIDTHVHLWDPSILEYPWLKSVPELDRAYGIQDYLEETGRRAPGKFIFIESGCRADFNLREVEFAEGIAAVEPRLAGIVANVAIERGAGIEGELDLLASKPLVKGIRRNLQGESVGGFCLQPGFVAGIELLARYGLTFDLCIRHDQLPDVTKLVKMVPGVRFVLDHIGKPAIARGEIEPWAGAIRALAFCPNVVCKLSGLVTEANLSAWTLADLRPYYQTVLDAFGPDRMLFGGDWPVVNLAATYGRWLDAVEEMLSGLSDAQRDRVFRTNAAAVYRI